MVGRHVLQQPSLVSGERAFAGDSGARRPDQTATELDHRRTQLSRAKAVSEVRRYRVRAGELGIDGVVSVHPTAP